MANLVDITNSCRYKIEPHHEGGLFYNIQAEQITGWRTVALYSKGKLDTYAHKEYKTHFQDGIIKVYRKGKMQY